MPPLPAPGLLQAIAAARAVPDNGQIEAVPQVFEVPSERRFGYLERRQKPVHPDGTAVLQHRLNFVEALGPVHLRSPMAYLLFVYHRV